KRQTAYKVTVKDIIDSRYIKTSGMEPNYLEVGSKQISRVNILGVIVEKLDMDNYKALVIDDGSGRISARVFDGNIFLSNVEVGDVVNLIGRPREFSSEKYVIIEAIKKTDPAWARVRDLELQKNSDNSKKSKVIQDKEEKVDSSPKNKIILAIKELDDGDGVLIENILSKNVDGAEKIIDTLLKEGGIFEVKPGKLKVLE
ncbi:MAG: hypothetical protein AABX74_03205, partial [Nanoarchaeota archaeon]